MNIMLTYFSYEEEDEAEESKFKDDTSTMNGAAGAPPFDFGNASTNMH